MKDDHIQGILFSQSPIIRFREVPKKYNSFVGKTWWKAKRNLPNPTLQLLINEKKNYNQKFRKVRYIDYTILPKKTVLQEKDLAS